LKVKTYLNIGSRNSIQFRKTLKPKEISPFTLWNNWQRLFTSFTKIKLVIETWNWTIWYMIKRNDKLNWLILDLQPWYEKTNLKRYFAEPLSIYLQRQFQKSHAIHDKWMFGAVGLYFTVFYSVNFLFWVKTIQNFFETYNKPILLDWKIWGKWRNLYWYPLWRRIGKNE